MHRGVAQIAFRAEIDAGSIGVRHIASESEESLARLDGFRIQANLRVGCIVTFKLTRRGRHRPGICGFESFAEHSLDIFARYATRTEQTRFCTTRVNDR